MKKKKNIKNVTSFIDLFAGIGGFRIAWQSLGLKCVFSSEIDKYAKKTYYVNFGEMPRGDITNIPESSIPDHDILCGGFPCQAFSVSGKQKGFNDARGTLFFDIARIAKEKRPRVLFLENVKNLEKHDSGNTLKTVLRILDEIGYNAFYKVLNASNYGVPTARERIYFVCFRKDLGIKKFDFPQPARKEIYLRDLLEKDVELSSVEIRRNDINLYALGNNKKKMGPIQIGTINSGGQGERIYSINGHAVTLSAHGGGAAAKTGAYLVDGKIRKLTPRECARVMGFPETFKVPVTNAQAYKQFGNSVAVPVVRAIAEKIIETINPIRA